MPDFAIDFQETRQGRQTSLVRITPEVQSLLKEVVSLKKWNDTYLNSPAYYLITGRNGLWLYGDDDAVMLVARHPNDPEQLLLFPPLGKNPFGLIRKAQHDVSFPDGRLRLARIGFEETSLIHRLITESGAQEREEDLLDWRYPVHILGTKEVVEHKGAKFKDFRNNVHRARSRGLNAEPIKTKAHILDALAVCRIWASRHVNEHYSLPNLMEPSVIPLELLERRVLPVQGLVAYENGLPIGYIVWEETDPKTGTANSIAGLSIRSRGTDEFLVLEMCRVLAEKGFSRVCIGGSETEGLDAFKRKMCPVASIPLRSFAIARESSAMASFPVTDVAESTPLFAGR
ncbi:MAG: DUF2156 domain-containing protein [Alphaproteobacteria bacterium]|nr:DUF2156 domain-containing protein [Alphaproteobacteria bacterium]